MKKVIVWADPKVTRLGVGSTWRAAVLRGLNSSQVWFYYLLPHIGLFRKCFLFSLVVHASLAALLFQAGLLSIRQFDSIFGYGLSPSNQSERAGEGTAVDITSSLSPEITPSPAAFAEALVALPLQDQIAAPPTDALPEIAAPHLLLETGSSAPVLLDAIQAPSAQEELCRNPMCAPALQEYVPLAAPAPIAELEATSSLIEALNEAKQTEEAKQTAASLVDSGPQSEKKVEHPPPQEQETAREEKPPEKGEASTRGVEPHREALSSSTRSIAQSLPTASSPSAVKAHLSHQQGRGESKSLSGKTGGTGAILQATTRQQQGSPASAAALAPVASGSGSRGKEIRTTPNRTAHGSVSQEGNPTMATTGTSPGRNATGSGQGHAAVASFASNPAPAYPEAARQKGEEGIVIVAATVDGSGHILSASVARSCGFARLDEAAIAAVSSWRLQVPAPARFKVPIRFRLKS